MADGHDGVVEDHAGAGKAHDFPDFFPHVRAVAVGPAIGVEGLGSMEGRLVRCGRPERYSRGGDEALFSGFPVFKLYMVHGF